MTPTTLPEDGIIHLVGWPDARADAVGYPVAGPYVEHFWLGVLGPTATWLLRRCAAWVAADPSGTRVDLGTLAATMGLAYRPGRPTPFARGFDRCIMFGLVRHLADSPVPLYAVRTRVPALSARHLARLPAELRTAHADFIDGGLDLVGAR